MEINSVNIRELAKRPIPNQEENRTRKPSYVHVPIDVNHPLYNDPVVNIQKFGIAGENHYFMAKNPSVPGAIPSLLLRTQVAEKLTEADQILRSCGYRLFVEDAWRPQSVQRHVRTYAVLNQLKKEFPNDSNENLIKRTLTLSADSELDMITSPPPHSTGGAVDVTLQTIEGNKVDMGKGFGLFKTSFPDALELNKELMHSEAVLNRRLLYWAMVSAGFSINPSEWWHFCWGDQMWAVISGNKTAHYGSINPLEQ